YVPVINGIPLRSGGMAEQVFVGRDGKVHNALFMPVRIKPIGKMVTLRPAETVLQEFVNGDQKVISTSGWGGSSAAKAQGAPEKRPFYREPQLIVGDEIEAEGYVQHWVAADGGADQFSILALNGQTFVLEADQLDLAQATDQQEVTVSGRLIEQAGPGFWRMKVSAVTPLSDAASQSNSQGVVRRQSDGVWLETANGQKYVLPDAPVELANGTRVYVPGILVKSADQPLHLEWQIMTPVDETQKPSTNSSGMVIMPASVSRPAEMVQAAPEGSSASSAPTLPAWWTYQPGDEVTLEGELSMQGMRYRSSGGPVQGATTSPDKLFFDASLLVKSDPSSAAYELNVVLVGDAVNLDLLRLSGLTLRVQGRVLSAQEAESRFPNRGAVTPLVEITHYEQANPAETKAIFDGGLRIATVGDRRVAIISDTLSQREYMLADSLAYSETLRMYESMLQGEVTLSLIGVTAPDQTYGGYPIVRTAEIHVNSDGSAEILPQLRERLANPIQDIELESRGPVDAVIDRIELVYVFQWLPPGASPADGSTVADVGYHVTGHSSDNRYTLAYDLRAAVEP
ncbi:MAG TPA: hypothetical protein VLG46_10150, partial [Anaerolineae bacterium]|nr:hypothetical protein [Anaerolineae bacterium]